MLAPPNKAPSTHQEAGINPDLLMRLTLKMLHSAGELSGIELARRLGVLFAVIEPTLEFLKLQRQCEVVAGALVGGASYRYRMTSDGRTTATQLLLQDQYVGPIPVPLSQYTAYVRAQYRSAPSRVNRPAVAEAFGHLVLSDKVTEEIGTAARSGRSIFIYGPPGNGKSVIAEGLRTLLHGHVAIPHAIEVEGTIVRVYDPMNHERLEAASDDDDRQLLGERAPQDGRWVWCRRPMVKVGGELMLESLDLTFNERDGYYRAPVQVIANGGVLVLDDFGRQRCSPAEILNRWMVPLESGVDFLTLRSGQKFEVPFATFIAFATNARPSDLVDEAFLRRVPFKVFAANPTRDEFIRIFANHAASRDVEPGNFAEYLLDAFFRANNIAPRGCHPRDLINQALLLADYRGERPALTRELLDTACSNYFLEGRLETMLAAV